MSIYVKRPKRGLSRLRQPAVHLCSQLLQPSLQVGPRTLGAGVEHLVGGESPGLVAGVGEGLDAVSPTCAGETALQIPGQIP